MARLRHAIEVLGRLGKKKLKKIEKTAADMPDFWRMLSSRFGLI